MAKRTKPHNSGRKVGSGMYGHPTSPIRVPTFLVGSVKAFVQTMLKINGLKPIEEAQVRQWLESLTNTSE